MSEQACRRFNRFVKSFFSRRPFAGGAVPLANLAAYQPVVLWRGVGRRAAIMDAFNSRYKQHQHEVWAEFYLRVDVVVK